MVMWMYVPERRIRVSELERVQKLKECLACGSLLLRVAERAPDYPYHWLPNGFICSKCNLSYMGVP
jgi:hypothetical protein